MSKKNDWATYVQQLEAKYVAEQKRNLELRLENQELKGELQTNAHLVATLTDKNAALQIDNEKLKLALQVIAGPDTEGEYVFTSYRAKQDYHCQMVARYLNYKEVDKRMRNIVTPDSLLEYLITVARTALNLAK